MLPLQRRPRPTPRCSAATLLPTATAVVCVAALFMSNSRVVLHVPARWEAAVSSCAPSSLSCLVSALRDGRKRIIVTVASEGVLPWLMNLLVSMSRVQPRAPENVLVAALDQATFDRLNALRVPVYWSPPAAPDGQPAPPLAQPRAAAALFGTPGFYALVQQKNRVVRDVLAGGSAVFFSDADTVWLRDPLDEDAWGAEPPWPPLADDDTTAGSAAASGAGRGPGTVSDPTATPFAHGSQSGTPAVSALLGHACSALRLGDTVSGWGELPPWAARRADCPGGSGGQWAYDVIGMYGDAGGMDTGYWRVRGGGGEWVGPCHRQLLPLWRVAGTRAPPLACCDTWMRCCASMPGAPALAF